MRMESSLGKGLPQYHAWVRNPDMCKANDGSYAVHAGGKLSGTAKVRTRFTRTERGTAERGMCRVVHTRKNRGGERKHQEGTDDLGRIGIAKEKHAHLAGCLASATGCKSSA